ncbi:GNAT family N-acetyltransferase [Dasania marina]|uniref:GNAT family N-acetyltransferase n=1 Tax=Dasania marina TaxID=471499 RepID=UPI00037A88FD|nr:GNAT family protein [Dasania marina]
MEYEINQFHQPVGLAINNWTPPPLPKRTVLTGRFCHLEPLASHHTENLYAANQVNSESDNWTYLPYGPFSDSKDYQTWIEQYTSSNDPLFYAIVNLSTGKAAGVASYLRITPNMGTIEVGHIHYSPNLQRSPAATEAMFLMMDHAFSLGYRRYEWKCDALNAPSRAAAQRLGFSFEGIFRQAVVVKGRNRDTAWYATTDQEWPTLKAAFIQWLSPGNFDENGNQKTKLSDLTAPCLQNII